MVAFLAVVAILSYLFAIFALLIVLGDNGSDLQLIISALAATCGTVALAGAGIIQRLEDLKARSSTKLGPSGEIVR